MARAQDVRSMRRSTMALIKREGQNISLFRAGGTSGGFVDDGEGGEVPAPTPVGEDPSEPVSEKRRYFSTTEADPEDRGDDDGERLLIPFVLIGRWDDDIREGDWFYVNDQKFEIDFVQPDREYQLKGQGVAFGNGR